MRVTPAAVQFTPGAVPDGDGVRFRVWAPRARRVEVSVEHPSAITAALARDPGGWFEGRIERLGAGARYRYGIDGDLWLPDPASRFQPDGVHGPSEVIDSSAYRWQDAGWGGVRRRDLVIYELHVGTFTPGGTFDAARERLPDVAGLGATAIELMPLAEFPGARNWGYDGVGLFAPSRAYGRPDDLRRLVDAAHAAGLAVLLDVVYNHLGPEGAYLPAFAPEFFTERHHTPWGRAVNLDGAGSEHVRRFLIENARHWLREYHVDGFRLDATHALIDDSPTHFLRQLTAELRRERPDVIVIAEDERKLPEMTRAAADGGWDLDGVWADDLHHQLRRLLAGDHESYFARYAGTTAEIAATLERGWFLRRTLDGRVLRADEGASGPEADLSQFVVCLQNHDQIGNRALGDRLHHAIDAAAFRAATALLLIAPETPLLFMGQEWGASTPFLYFTDHPEPLGSMVTAGRRQEFGAFSAFRDPAARARIPDPQQASTFDQSKLRWDERSSEPHASLLRLHRALLDVRRRHAPLAPRPDTAPAGVCVARALDADTIALRRAGAPEALLVVAKLRGAGAVTVPRELLQSHPVPRVRLTTEDDAFASPAARPSVDAGDGALRIVFQRPGAVLLTC